MTEKLERTKVTDATSFVWNVVRKAYWDAHYQAHHLKRETANVKWARELMERLKVNPDIERADRDEDGEVVCFQNLSQFVMEIVDDAESLLKHHESALVSAHNEVAYVLTMLARGNYSEIDVEEVRRQVKSEFDADPD